jgi:hypothetical protein
MYQLAMKIFFITILISVILSFFILMHLIYHKKHNYINVWSFPMLLAILIELFIHKQY